MGQLFETFLRSWESFLAVMFSLSQNQTFLTVVSGSLVFVIGQLFNEYWLKPIQKYKEIRAKIAYELVLYANLYMNPERYENANEKADIASEKIRQLAAEVDAMIELKPKFNFFIARKGVLTEVSKNLIGLSNGFYSHGTHNTVSMNDKARSEIYHLLKLESHKEKIRIN